MKTVIKIVLGIVIAFFILIAGCTFMIGGCTMLATESVKEGVEEMEKQGLVEKTETPKVEQKQEVKEIVYSMNQNINVDYLIYKITKAETFTKMGTSILKKESNGKFIKVYLDITNNAKETKQIFTPRFKIIDNFGREYDRLSDDMMYIADYLEFGKQLQPGLKTSGAIVFELPTDSKDLKLEIRGDWLSEDKIMITLSNIRDIGTDMTLKEKQDEMMEEITGESQKQVEEIMNKCNAPFTCTSSCPQFMDAGQKNCPSGQVCCIQT